MTGAATTRRTRIVRVRVSAGEERVLRETAAQEGVTVSALVRGAIAERWLKGRVTERADGKR
jgi:hypothetical protein